MSNFSQILTFIEVANTRSFAEASRRLSLSTSTVSARVKSLEKRIKVRLLNRNTRNVTLTDEGEIYLQNCQKTFEALLEVEESLSQRTYLSGRIKVTIPKDFPLSNFSKILANFKTIHKQVSIDVIVTDESLDLVTNNIDVAIRGGKPGGFSLVSRKIGEGDLLLISNPTYWQQKNQREGYQNFEDQVVFDPLEILPTLPKKVPYLKGRLGTQDFELVKQFILHSQGIGILPESVCKSELETGDLVSIPFVYDLPKLPLYIVYPSRSQLPIRVRSFIDYLIQSLGEYPLV